MMTFTELAFAPAAHALQEWHRTRADYACLRSEPTSAKAWARADWGKGLWPLKH